MLDKSKYLVAAASLASFVVFILIFTATFLAQPMLEKAASSFLRSRIQEEVRERLGSGIGADAAALAKWFEARSETVRDFMENELDAFVDEVVNSLCCADAEESDKASWKETLKRTARDVAIATSDDFAAIASQLSTFVRGQYEKLVRSLVREIRIFSGLNAALFALVLALLFARWRDPRGVLLPAILLLVATFTCVGFYVFAQNWFYTILTQRYAGYGYLAFVGTVLGLLVVHGAPLRRRPGT